MIANCNILMRMFFYGSSENLDTSRGLGFSDDIFLLVKKVVFVDEVVDEKAFVGDPGPEGEEGKEEEGEQSFPRLHNAWGVANDDHVEPNVGQDRPGGSYAKHS